MLTGDQISSYHENGFLAVEDVFTPAEVARARAVVDELVEASRAYDTHTDVYDLEPTHSAERPRVRRLKAPLATHPYFEELARKDSLLDLVADLLGPAIRLHGNKLNMKAAEFGSAVEWHQDFAFYPHTNDDLLAVGIAIDHCLPENGCMLMVPGSHRWPILDHHQDGYFVGAIDPDRLGVDLEAAVPVPVHAGGITLHHCRTLHGSAPNTSPHPRRLFLLELAAVDAWPCAGVPDLEAFDARVWRGSPTSTYRVTSMDIRPPLPKHERQGSIYEVQTPLRAKLFAAGKAAPVT
ncbi:MAG: phytanoyl-CoA dioxygenase [Armatimonadetes bacterium]|jgi:ectoine hydroxylase-related dioxygenase (phytanoyl-CoA dioxygenase family)|nr:phytanoyl-CoA dioxygenase [Armatimonadota bacterium]